MCKVLYLTHFLLLIHLLYNVKSYAYICKLQTRRLYEVRYIHRCIFLRKSSDGLSNTKASITLY